MKSHQSRFAIILLFTLTVLLCSSCEENSINPIEDDRGIFSFYGYMQVGESPNYVRVRNIDEPFLSEMNSLDGVVTFENMKSGEIHTLRDTTINFMGNLTHNYIIEEEINFDTTYLLAAERSDGLVSKSKVKTPEQTELILTPSENVQCLSSINFTFKNVAYPERIHLTISAEYQGIKHTGDLEVFADELERIDESDEVRIRLSPSNLLVEVFTPILPDNPYFDPFRLFPTVSCSQLDTSLIEITYTHYGAEWATAQPFGGAINTDSGVVENGLGFFGSFIRETVVITLSE
ncbi:hypothetical protein DYD21_14705 [Rhodohalobacter sp. SW132]|uniref:hypothetical protein n=1 Tax=Rhodohalobacter sp. SW132 TaxID=2293433 RepID=UPI000E243DB5|nr:hypothetical protein [Rhodohalobacter sp. SW132]REL29105.1 hypothetical protein DYD21_14705 [Rhodohalobacter sp. SW132]